MKSCFGTNAATPVQWRTSGLHHTAVTPFRHAADLVPQPSYWQETVDVPSLLTSSLFSSTSGFGGNGVAPYGCVADGPFANVSLHFTQTLQSAEYCIIRSLNPCPFQGAKKEVIDQCLASASYEELWNCAEAMPHAAGHAGVGGVVGSSSPTSFSFRQGRRGGVDADPAKRW